MGRHAYLIMVHSDPYIFDKLLDLINDARNDIFIHIDAKCDSSVFEQIACKYKKSSIFFCKDRLKVYWGDYSQVETELHLFYFSAKKMAEENRLYDRVHLISGVDLPLKSQNEIHTFFDQYTEKEFIQYEYPSELINNKYSKRYKYYTCMHFASRGISKKIILHGYLLLSNTVQRILKINRIGGIAIAIGSNWVSITPQFLKYIISQKQWIRKTYRYTICPDESFLQTLLLGSEFVKNLYNPEMNGSCVSNLRNIDWKRGRPYVWRMEDYDELMCSGLIFARKFSSTIDKEIVDKIYKTIK